MMLIQHFSIVGIVPNTDPLYQTETSILNNTHLFPLGSIISFAISVEYNT